MSKIRINDLARELEVKSKAILDVLALVGVTEKKTHSSSVEEHEAEKVRAHFRAARGPNCGQTLTCRPPRNRQIKTKIDLSHISRPGDVLNAIRKQQAPASVAVPHARPGVDSSAGRNQAGYGHAGCPSREGTGSNTTHAPASATGDRADSNGKAHFHSSSTADATSSQCYAGDESRFNARARSGTDCAACGARRNPGSAMPPAAPAQPPAPMWRGRAAPDAPRGQAPLPRMIVPQTGPRPVYKAPPRPVAPAAEARRAGSAGPWTASARTADFSASAPGGASGCPLTAASGRAPADAPDAPVACGRSPYRRGSRRAAARSHPSRQPSRRAGAPARSALHSTRGEGRPDEGLRSAAAA